MRGSKSIIFISISISIFKFKLKFIYVDLYRIFILNIYIRDLLYTVFKVRHPEIPQISEAEI